MIREDELVQQIVSKAREGKNTIYINCPLCFAPYVIECMRRVSEKTLVCYQIVDDSNAMLKYAGDKVEYMVAPSVRALPRLEKAIPHAFSVVHGVTVCTFSKVLSQSHVFTSRVNRENW